MGRPRRNIETNATIRTETDALQAEARHEHLVATVEAVARNEAHPSALDHAQSVYDHSTVPTGEVSADEHSLGFDPSQFKALGFRGYRQPELPFREEFKSKAHLWQFSWVPWAKRGVVKGQPEYGYSAVVRKGETYLGHKYDDMFPPEAFNAGGGNLIGEGNAWDETEKTYLSEQVLAVRPVVAFEQDQKAIVEGTEQRFQSGENINPGLRNIIDSSGGLVTVKPLEPGMPVLTQQPETRWRK